MLVLGQPKPHSGGIGVPGDVGEQLGTLKQSALAIASDGRLVNSTVASTGTAPRGEGGDGGQAVIER